MIIYRMQDIEGRGPFRPGFSHLWVEPRNDHGNLMPFFVEFGPSSLLEMRKFKYSGCGCKNPNQLRIWILESEYWTLMELGYYCAKMGATALFKSSIQCVFRRKYPLNKHFKRFDLY
jgi:hypothetical protein